MFDIQPSIFDRPTYLRKQQPLAGSPPEQALPEPQPPVRVPYRPLAQATPLPRILSPLAHPSQRQQIAAPEAPPSAAPAPQVPSQPATQPSPSQPSALPPQAPPTATPPTQSTGAAPKVAPASLTQSPTTAPSPQPIPRPTGPAPLSPVLPPAQTPTPPASSQPPQPRPTATPAPQNFEEEDPKVVAALKEASAQTEADSAVRRRREDRRAKLESVGMSAAATSLEALDDEAEARRAELAKKYPQRGPEYEAGIQALTQHLKQQQAQIHAKARQLPEIAAQIYQQWGHGVTGNWITGQAPKENDPYSPGAPLSSTHLAVLDQEAKKYGVDPKDLRHHLEMQRLSDWSRPSTSHANWEQENFVNKTLNAWSGKGPAEPARVLPDGRITVNPTLGEDKAAFDKAIDKTYSTPEAKAAARQMWPAYHDRWLTAATETLKNSKRFPGVEDYNEWLTNNQLAGHFSEKLQDGSVRLYTDNEKTQLYLDAMKSRPGWLKFADNLATSLTAGGGQIIAGGMGLAAMGAGAIEYATGLDVGRDAFSEAAADKDQENKALTQSHELTGTTDGFGTRLLSSLSQALPSTVLGMVTGGGTGGAAIMSALQTAGGQYAETYGNNIRNGMPPDKAFARSASAAAFSGLMSGLLTKAFPGGTTALNSSAIRNTLSTGAGGTALRGSIKDAIRTYAATSVQGAKALASGMLDEIPQEVLDEGISQLSSAWAEKKDMKQAMADFFTGLPQLIATSGILGAGGQHVAQSHSQQTQAANPQAPIPDTTTASSTGSPATPSGQPPSQTTASNSQPPSAPPSPPLPSPEATSKALQGIQRLQEKAATTELSPEEKLELDQDEKTRAAGRIHHLENEQKTLSGLNPSRELHPAQAKKLADERAILQRPEPGRPPAAPPQPSIPETTTRAGADSGQQSSATVNNSQPPQTSPSGSGQPQQTTASNSQPSQTPAAALPVPTFEEAGAAKQTIDKLKAQKGPLSTEQQQTLDAAEKTFARRTEDNILNQQAGIEKRGGKLHPTTAKALQEAQATLARLKPAADTPSGNSGDGDHTPPAATRGAHTDSSQPAPDSAAPASPPAPIPQTTTQKAAHGKAADSDQPPQTSPDSRPTPPQSVEQPPSPRENSGKQTPEAPQNSGKQDDTSGDTPWGTHIPDTTTQHDSDPASPKAAAADPEASSAPPDSSRQNGTPPGATSPGQPSQTSPAPPHGPGEAGSPGQPASPSRASLPPPRTPPLSVAQSQHLIDNVANMSPDARQHPQVQADLAQARDVVAEAANRTPASSNFAQERGSSLQPQSGPRGVSGAAAADEHMVPWSNNPDGKTRTIPEALDVFRKNMKNFLAENPHINLDPNLLNQIEFKKSKGRLAPEGSPVKWAKYGPFYKGSGINGEVTWKDLFDGDKIPVMVDPRVLASDQAILGIFAHEMYEIQSIRDKMKSNPNKSLSPDQLQMAINDFHTAAVRLQNRLVQFMKANSTPPPQ